MRSLAEQAALFRAEEGARCLLAFFSGTAAGGLLDRYIRAALEKRGRVCRCKLDGPVNGLVCLWVCQAAGWGRESLLYCIGAFLLLAAAAVDAEAFEIPVECCLALGLLGAARLFLVPGSLGEALGGIFAASGILLVIFALTGGEGIGGGDIKLLAGAGFFLGGWKILLALFAGAAAAALCRIFLGRTAGGSGAFAFGPYLAWGIMAAMLYGDRIFGWLP